MQDLLRSRRVVFGNCLVIVAILLLTRHSQKAFAGEYEVHGRVVNWSVSVPDDWIGGSFYQDEWIIQQVDLNLRDILSSAQAESKDKEAVMIHLKDAYDVAHTDLSFTTRTLTEILVTLGSPGAKATSLENAYETVLRIYGPSGVTRKSGATFRIHQMMAHEAIFEERPEQGGMLYHDFVAVPLPSGELLTFLLRVDSSRYAARARTFRQIVASLKFH
jgi:hypothetical protein